MANDIVEASTLPLLQSNSGAYSDHHCVFAACDLGQNRDFKWVVKMSRRRTQEREEFAAELGRWTLGDPPASPRAVDDMAMALEQKNSGVN